MSHPSRTSLETLLADILDCAKTAKEEKPETQTLGAFAENIAALVTAADEQLGEVATTVAWLHATADGLGLVPPGKDDDLGVIRGALTEWISRTRQQLSHSKGGHDPSRPDDLRAQGLAVGVHNDYRLNGETHTFWLFTAPGGMSYKGEGRTDTEALDQVRNQLGLTVSDPGSEAESRGAPGDMPPADAVVDTGRMGCIHWLNDMRRGDMLEIEGESLYREERVRVLVQRLAEAEREVAASRIAKGAQDTMVSALSRELADLKAKEAEYRADFLWSRFESDELATLGYEFANAKSEDFRQEVWRQIVQLFSQARTRVLQGLVEDLLAGEAGVDVKAGAGAELLSWLRDRAASAEESQDNEAEQESLAEGGD